MIWFLAWLVAVTIVVLFFMGRDVRR